MKKGDQHNYLNKKGISGVIVTVLMIALVLAVVVVVWNVINNLVGKKLGEAESCFDVLGKVSINPQYTCYESANGKLRFSIDVGDINVTKIIVAISAQGSTNSYELSSEANDNLDTYPMGNDAIVPGKRSGRSYLTLASSYTTKPDKIQISPVIGAQQCEVSDSLTDIEECID